MNVYAHHPHFDRHGRKRPIRIVFSKRSNVFNDSFELHGAFFGPWRIDQVGSYGCQPGHFKLIRLVAVAHLYLVVRYLTVARQASQSIDGVDQLC